MTGQVNRALPNPRGALRALAAEPLPPLPTVEQLTEGRTLRRPGELHEVVTLSPSVVERIADEAARAGIDQHVAAGLLLEAGLVAAEMAHHAPTDRTLAGGPPVPLPAASARYLRSLTFARRRVGHVRGTRYVGVMAVPVRLMPRLSAVSSLDDLAVAVPLATALRWEVAAVREGRTMTEWALATALRAAS